MGIKKKYLFTLLLAPSIALSAESELQTLKNQVQILEQKINILADQPTNTGSSSKTYVGGYGELHYNVTDGEDPSFDYHRFVFLLDHEFTPKVKFYSELEVEHAIAGENQNGEIELEQAYIDWNFTGNWYARFGMLLQPIGFINETHEPDTFYGVERPIVEKYIIPTTWWESGISLGWRPNGWKVDLMVAEGLYDPDGTSIRSARQKSSETKSQSLSYTLRADYTAIPGLLLGASLFYQSDLTQGDGPSTPATQLSLKAALQRGPFGLRALWAQWKLDGAAARLNNADEQQGYYIEPSYKITDKLGVFTRYSHWYTNTEQRKSRWLSGINYWIHPQVVLKADIRSEADNNGYNLGVGYSF